MGIEMESITENSEGLTQTGRERGRGVGGTERQREGDEK